MDAARMATARTPMTPNQLVAASLHHARTERGWTQQQAVEALQGFGVTWSKQILSQAENAQHSPNGRQFTPNELVALCLVFKRPLAWWLLPGDARHEVVLANRPLGLDEFVLTLLSAGQELTDRLDAYIATNDELAKDAKAWAREALTEALWARYMAAEGYERERMTGAFADMAFRLGAMADLAAKFSEAVPRRFEDYKSLIADRVDDQLEAGK